MRILFLGAGAVGGYFGGRLAQAGADVSFLVRPGRRLQLQRDGLRVKSALGDIEMPVRTVTSEDLEGRYDLVVLSCKAYDLDSAIDSIRPALADDGEVLPLLNGIAHLDTLATTFGAHRVLGGVVHIGATVDANGTVLHLNRAHRITFGPRDGHASRHCAALAEALAKTPVHSVPTDNIMLAMWEKFVMLASLAALTTTARANVGEFVQADEGRAIALEMHAECSAIAAAAGYPPREEEAAQTRTLLTEAGSTFSSSMLRDIENGGRIEGTHIVGDMLARARSAGIATPLLRIARFQLQAYEARRAAGRLPGSAAKP